MAEVLSKEAQINAFIEKSVREYWQERHEPLLLSFLGSNIKNVFADSETVLIKGLRRHLDTWPIATVVVHPNQKQKIGLVPLDVQVPSDPSSLFPEYEKRPSVVHSRNDFVIYRQDFWNSFLSPIRAKRFIVVTGDQNFLITDSPPDNLVNGTAYEIQSDDVVTVPQETPASEKAKLARAKIETWLAKHDLDKRIFEKQKGFVHSGETTTNAFDAFASLEPADQARISVPLDIVIKLFGAKAR